MQRLTTNKRTTISSVSPGAFFYSKGDVRMGENLQESIDKLNEFFINLANVLRDVISKAWSFIKYVAWNFEQVEQLKEQRKDKQRFVPIVQTKGNVYKSQVYNNKPRFAKARSNL